MALSLVIKNLDIVNETLNTKYDKNIQREIYIVDKISSIFNLLIIIVAFAGNAISFIIFRLDIDLRKISSFLLLSFVVLIENFAVVTYNLNRFINPYFGIVIHKLNIFTCKYFLFLQYFSLQCNGILLCLVLIDRFVMISRTPGSIYEKLPFCTMKSALIWSISVIIFFFLLNSHILLLSGYEETIINYKNSSESFNSSSHSMALSNNKKLMCYNYASDFNIKPIWDIVNMILYSLIPSFIMIFLSFILLFKTFKNNIKLNSTIQKTLQKKRKITLSLLAIFVAYALLTLPPTIYFAFIKNKVSISPSVLRNISNSMDIMQFGNHASIIFTSLIFNSKFRHTFYRGFNFLFRISQNRYLTSNV